jgi:antitoxin VapB
MKEATVPGDRHVRLFKNGRNQALRIPREFELPGNEAILRREGNRLIIDPVQHRSLLALLATWESFEEDFPEIGDLRPEPVDL